jgi:hypothetical protein
METFLHSSTPQRWVLIEFHWKNKQKLGFIAN